MSALRRLTALSIKPIFLAVAAIVLAVAGLAAAVTRSDTVTRADALANQTVHDQASDRGAEMSFAVTDLAGTSTVWLITAAAFALLVALRHWRGAIALVVAVASTQLVVQLLKEAIERPRPDAGFAEHSGFSFPSAHSATGMALYLMLTLIAARAASGRLRVLIAVLGGAVIVAIGITRVYLGAHYPTDVLAGWLTGAAIVLLSWQLAKRIPLPRPAAARA
jgi:membrane-associated phospholipid phosphatase